MSISAHRQQLAALDLELGSGLFGDASALTDSTNILYSGLHTILERNIGASRLPHLSAAETLSEKIVVRRALDEAFAHLTNGDTRSAKSKVESAVALLDALPGSLSHTDAGPFTVFSRWTEDPCAASVADAFVRSMLDEGFDISVVAPDENHIECIERASALLKTVLPFVFANTVSLAPGVSLIKGRLPSAYINENPLTFVINVAQFQDSALLAESLLHEALHQKLVDIRLTCTLLAEGYDDLASETRGDVLVPWPDVKTPRKWSAARAMAAFHVYTHLAVLYAAIRESESFSLSNVGAETIEERTVIAFERARYLGEALGWPQLTHRFGPDGRRLHAWLSSALRLVGTLEVNSQSVAGRPASWEGFGVDISSA